MISGERSTKIIEQEAQKIIQQENALGVPNLFKLGGSKIGVMSSGKPISKEQSVDYFFTVYEMNKNVVQKIAVIKLC